MRSLLVLALAAGSVSAATAQTAAPEVVASAGGRFVGSTLSLSWTLGEVAIESYSNGGILFTQGFHQPVLTLVSVEEEASNFKDRISFYPNPATDHISVRLSEAGGGIFRIELRNLAGEQVYTARSSEDVHRIDMDLMASGLYVLSVYTQSGSLAGSYKIQKHR